MFPSDVDTYRNPRTGGRLQLVHGDAGTGEALVGDGDAFEVVRGIPRFCPGGSYADSFGYQWNRYDTVQLDSAGGWGNVSEQRLFDQTEWPRDLRGERILEAGCGMGRFTQHLLAAGADVWSVDSSIAVEANARNNGTRPNLHLAQADINRLPFPAESFDRVLCIGVIQHTPDPARTFGSLVRMLRPGGHIAIDCYLLDWRIPLRLNYWARPLTSRLRPATLQRLVKAYMAFVYPLTGAAQRLFGERARALSWVLGMADYRGAHPGTPETLRRLAELDTFDMLSPAHDHPKTIGQVRRWFEDNRLIDIRVRPGWNGIEAIGRRS